jgi:hypothetical protein
MKRATRKTRAKPQGVRPLSRRALAAEVVNLSERLDRHLEIAEAIAAANKPNDQHIAIERDLRVVFGLLLDGQMRSLRDIQGFARILARRDDA